MMNLEQRPISLLTSLIFKVALIAVGVAVRSTYRAVILRAYTGAIYWKK